MFFFKKHSEFEVDSKNFEGKKHKWVLSRLLQKGYEKSNESFFQVFRRFFLNINLFHILLIVNNFAL